MPKHPPYRRTAMSTGKHMQLIIFNERSVSIENETERYREKEQPQKNKKMIQQSHYFLFISCSNLPFTEILASLLCTLMHPELQKG